MVQVIQQAPVTFYYDSDCGICSALAIWSARHTPVTLRSIQENEAALIAAGVPRAELLASAYAACDGRLLRGVDSIAALLAASAIPAARFAARVLTLPAVHPVAELAYRRVARNRARISQLLGLSKCRLT